MAHRARRAAQASLLSETSPRSLAELAARLQGIAIERGVTVATAESCTGGLVGHSITSVAGSSAYYLGGVISYADAVKVELVGVPRATLDRHGAVSAQAAVAMAEGVRERTGCDVAVAVTGVAGPDGGSAAKPVGLTYVAVAGATGHDVRRHLWSGDRAANKEQSAEAALDMLIRAIGEPPGGVEPLAGAAVGTKP